MSTKGRPGGPPGQRDRQRPAPTIDLQATEVAREPFTTPQPAEPPAPEPPVAAQPAAAPDAAAQAADKVPQVPSDRPRPDPLPQVAEHQPQIPSDGPRPSPPPVEPAATADEGRARPNRPAIAWLPPDFPWPLAAAAAAGVVVTLIVLAAAGVFSRREGSTATVEPRLARMEQALRELAARPAPVAADPKAVDDLAARVSRLEVVVATPKPPVTDTALANRIATLEGEIRALGERTGVLARRNDEIASIAGEARARTEAIAASLAELRKTQPPPASAVQRAEVEALTNRLAALERTMKVMESQLGRAGGDTASARSLRALVVASALNAAVERGTPFVAELTAAKTVAPDPKALAPLDPFAKSGVPSVDALARELAPLLPALAKVVGTTSREGGILERLKANAEKIVRIRPIDEARGDDPAAIVQRIEARAAQGNLAGAMTELMKLPAPALALAKEWIAKVEARNAAVEAGRRFAADALAALGKPSL